MLPKRRAARVLAHEAYPLSRYRRPVIVAPCGVVGVLSLNPIGNMLGRRQRMNASFDPLHLVNTYGAFGSVVKTRHEVVIEGTRGDPDDPWAEWREYEFPCEPTFGDPGWWNRTRVGTYLTALSKQGPRLVRVLRVRGWLERVLQGWRWFDVPLPSTNDVVDEASNQVKVGSIDAVVRDA